MDGRENFFVHKESLSRPSDGRLSGAKPRRRTKSGAILQSLSKNVYERCTSTGTGLVVFLGSDSALIFIFSSKDTKQDKYGGVKVYEQERVCTSG